jgi:hypothetical protein
MNARSFALNGSDRGLVYMESDTKRIEAELAGLSAEIAKLTAESKKVEAETAKLAAETPKLSAEAARLQWENEHAKEGRRLEWLKALGTSSAFLVAIAALTGFAWTVYNGIREHKRVDQKRQDERNQSADKDFKSAVSNIGDPDPSQRTLNVINLSVFLENEYTRYHKRSLDIPHSIAFSGSALSPLRWS